MLIMIVGVFLIMFALLVVRLGFMRQRQVSRWSASRPAAPGFEPAPAASRPALPPDLQWQRPYYRVTWALTRKNAGLLMAVGLGLILTVPFTLFWVGGFAARDWSSASPFDCIFLLPFVVIPLLIVTMQVWLLVTGVRDWQRVKLLEARGQLASGVILDRWIRRGRGVACCVAYYFALPWESGPVVRVEMNDEAYRAYQVGDAVSVRYLPDNPKVCRLEMSNQRPEG